MTTSDSTPGRFGDEVMDLDAGLSEPEQAENDRIREAKGKVTTSHKAGNPRLAGDPV